MTSPTIDFALREAEGCVVIDIAAENFTYPHSAALKAHITDLLAGGKRHVVLNVQQVQVVDSYGLATIVSSLKLIKDQHGALALCGLNEMFSHLVALTQLDKVLEIWPSESQATYYLSTLPRETSSPR